ncbi:AI-2E family transporter [Utexia brackfieldae]|uniref:AI-2E family transporter n=1 Tax=Utexia brackfieldae TaxID=3074108 RepID=UPI00370D86F6
MLLSSDQKLGLFCVALFSVFFIILMNVHLMGGVLAGLLTYTLTLKLDALLSKTSVKLSNKSKLISVLILSILIMAIFMGGAWYIFTKFLHMAKNPTETMDNAKMIIDNVSNTLPQNLRDYLPEDMDEILKNLTSYFKEHLLYLQSIVKNVFHILLIVIVGMIIGLILGFQENKRNIEEKNQQQTRLMAAFSDSMRRLVLVFQYVAISQVVISLFNTLMTAIFLFIILPIFDVHLPFSKSLVLATFVFGLIPIIGNLIVNVLMFLVAFTVSFGVAIVVIVYLIIIHKAEYVLNAKIVGTKVQAGICELLIAMLFLETLFGMIGLIFAPIFYAFIKLSLKQLKLI